MHETQTKILKLAKTKDVLSMKLTDLKELLGVDHVQKVKHHLDQLKNKGLIYFDSKSGHSKVADTEAFEINEIFNLPIMGLANCGTARELALENIMGYLKVSPKVVNKKKPDGLFVIKAVGNSLNKASDIKGGPVEDGDYVIIDLNKTKPDNGDYVLSIIDDAANLKRFYEDKTNKEIKLVSESTSNMPPIVLHKNDLESSGYMVNGVVVRVIKN